MANNSQQFIEALSHVPTDVQHPLLAGAAVAAAVALNYAAAKGFDHAHEQGAVDYRGHSELLQQSQLGTENDTNKKRLAPIRKMLLGAGLIGVQFLGQPGYTNDLPDTHSEAMVVIDVSNSMRYTHDMGGNTTRLEAAQKALATSCFPGQIGYEEAALSAQTLMSPVTNARDFNKYLTKPDVDSNGGNLLSGVRQAAPLLKRSAKNLRTSGTVLVISDGTIEDSKDKVAAEFASLEKQGVDVKVIVPGTASAKYHTPQVSQTYESGVKPGVFGNTETTTVTTTEALQKAICGDLKEAGTRHEHHEWPIPGALGGAALALGVAQMMKRTVTKY